jgi:hypothetical protein
VVVVDGIKPGSSMFTSVSSNETSFLVANLHG